ncbi:hypothetical protein CHL9767_08605, partial [Campylobacter hyointestinalis subsp. lawsonii]
MISTTLTSEYLFDNFIPTKMEILKNNFLNSIRANNGNYKRFTGSLLRYGGGKSLAVGLILENFPNDIKRIISPFIGG